MRIKFVLYSIVVLSFIFYAGYLYFLQDISTPSIKAQLVDALTEKISPREEEKPLPPPKKEIPRVVKAIYATMYSIGTEKKLEHLIDLIDKTSLNAIIIDFKGSNGELLTDYIDAKKVIDRLNEKNIYLIARVVAFQNSGMAKVHPEIMIKNANGNIWRDRKNFAWVDASSQVGLDELLKTSKQAIDLGFDEINYDYFRFPTDGALSQMTYPSWSEKKTSKFDTIHNAAKFLVKGLHDYRKGIVVSMDIFGYSFITNGDMGIGQRMEDLIEAFDYIYPMVYPSHYSTGNFGFQNPADHPYEVIKGTLDMGMATLKDKAKPEKIRPWLQVFNLGAIYTPHMIKLEMDATKDSLGEATSTGWLLWDPSNNYNNGEEYLGE